MKEILFLPVVKKYIGTSVLRVDLPYASQQRFKLRLLDLVSKMCFLAILVNLKS